MFGKKPPRVLVAGAGPVGLLTALVLARRGVRVQVVDKECRTGTHSYALALHASSIALLDDLGLVGQVLTGAYRIRTVGLYDGAVRKAELRISELSADHSFVAVMRQADLERLLEDALREAGVEVSWNHQVAELRPGRDGVSLAVETLDVDSLGYGVQENAWVVTKSKQLEVPFLVGADGHRSTVRRGLGIDFPQVGPTQDFAVFEFRTDAEFDHEMALVLGEQGSSVLWPLPGGYCRWSFEIPDFGALDERQKDRSFAQLGGTRYPVLDEQQLRTFLAERAPWFRGSIGETRWRMVVRFEKRLADSFGRDRVWLAGDSGHLTGPAGVQSMNVGLLEARALADAIADHLEGKAGDAALRTYAEARRAEWQRMLGTAGSLRAADGADPWLAAHAATLLPCIPASGADLERLAAQVGLGF